MPANEELKKNTGSQTHIQLKPGDIGEYVLLPGDPGRVEVFARFVDEPRKLAYNREFQTYAGYYKGIQVACTSTGIGCPSTAIAIEELANIGATTFIRIGTCGGLAEEVHAGDLIITTGTMRSDGTTPFYAPLGLPAVPDFYLTQALTKSAEELKQRLGIQYHVGLSGANDAYYGETSELMSKMRDWGLKGVEMESPAVFIVSQVRGLHGAAIFTVTATLFSGETLDLQAPRKDAPTPYDAMFTVALEAIHKIHSQKTKA